MISQTALNNEKAQIALVKGLKTGLSKNEDSNAKLKEVLSQLNADTGQGAKAGVVALKTVY